MRQQRYAAERITGDGTMDESVGCYQESYFHEMLALERKRSERSGKPFLVMTLGLAGPRDDENKRFFAVRAMETLSSETRETDIKGWYRNGEVLGVIFTEMAHIDPHLLEEKVRWKLQGTKLGRQVGAVAIAFYQYPEPNQDPGDDGSWAANFDFYPDRARKERARKMEFRIKRAIDIAGSLIAIVLLSPLFILIPICIKLTSRGPILFRQERIGRYGKKFVFLKFRSMYVANDEAVHKSYVQDLIQGNVPVANDNGDGKTKVFKIKNDQRVTPFGHLLRKTSMDELPQFFNVLAGSMSLVGPRPPIPYEIEHYRIWHRRRIMEIQPGITGLWQVTGRSSTSFDDMVRLDLQYLHNWSVWLDLKIILKTPWAIISTKGAY